MHSENADYKQEMEVNAGQTPVVCQYSMTMLKSVHRTMLSRTYEPQLVHSLTYTFQLTGDKQERVLDVRAHY